MRFRVSQTTKAVMTSVHSSLSLLRQQRVAATDMPHVRTYTSRRAAAAAARPTAAAASEEPPDDGPLADDDFVYFGLRLLIFGAAALRSLCFALSVLYISDPILLQDDDDKALVDCNKVLLKE